MKRVKELFKKLSIFVCVVLPLVMTFIIPIKSIAIGPTLINMDTYDATTIEAPTHEHIWSTKFDDDYHWEECSVCRNIRNKERHVLVGNGGSKVLCENGYRNQAYRETCSCGFQGKPQVVVHGRYENYVDCQTLNYGSMKNQSFDTIRLVPNAEYIDLVIGSNNHGTNPAREMLPDTPSGETYTWHPVGDDGLGLIFMGGPVIGDENGVKGTLELIIGAEGDCGKHSAFDEYFILTRYISSTNNPTRLGFVSYMENDTPNAAYINNPDHMLYGYPAKYRNRVSNEQWNQIVSIFRGYKTHTSTFSWYSMDIQHDSHESDGGHIYRSTLCYDSSNHHALSTSDGIPTNCDICDCHFDGTESYSADTWFRCVEHLQMHDGETKRCSGHALMGKNNTKLGTIYCNYTRENGVTTRTSVTVAPEAGFVVTQNTTTANVEIPKVDSTNAASQWTYSGIVALSNQQSGNALITRRVNCGFVHSYIDTVAPTAYGYTNHLTSNTYWKVEGVGTQTNPTTQSSIKVTFKDPQEYSRNEVKVKVYDADRTTILAQGNDVAETPLTKVAGTSGANTLWEGTINVTTEINGSKDIYIQAIDASGRTSELIPMQITYIDAQGPTLTITANANNDTWTPYKEIEVKGNDEYTYFSIGISNSDMQEVANNTYLNARTYVAQGDVYDGEKTIRFYAKDAAGNLTYKDYSVARIDATRPTVTNANVTVGKNSSTIEITANDMNTELGESGSGVVSYAISLENEEPDDSSFQASNIFTVTKPGHYYLFAKDAAGNISRTTAGTDSSAYEVNVPIIYNLTINPNGGNYNNSSAETVVELENERTQEVSAPTREGYTFTGWTLNGNGSTLTYPDNDLTQPAVFTMGTANATLTAKWTTDTDPNGNQNPAQAAYEVKHWQQKIYKNDDETKGKADSSIYNEENYTLVDTDRSTGNTDATVEPSVKTYEGFAKPEKQTLVIKGDGTAELNYYYTRNQYKLSVNKDENIESVEGEGTYLYGEKVKVNCTPKKGYSFKEWEGANKDLKQAGYITMPANNKEIKALSQKNKHLIKIDLGDTEMIIEAEYGDVITIDSPKKTDKEFLYFKTDDGEKIYNNKLKVEDKDYVLTPVWSSIQNKVIPKTGEEDNILLIIYSAIAIMSFGFAVGMASKSKK